MPQIDEVISYLLVRPPVTAEDHHRIRIFKTKLKSLLLSEAVMFYVKGEYAPGVTLKPTEAIPIEAINRLFGLKRNTND